MGNVISTTAKLSQISFASTIIGFISFLFTLATAIRVFWGNLRTLGGANNEVKDFLPNLKQSLYEERAHLRTIRRRCRGQYDEAAFQVLYNAVRNMIAEFRSIEKPFIDGPGNYASSHSSDDRNGNGVDRFRGMAIGAPDGRRGADNAKRRSSGRMTKEKRMENGDDDYEDDYYLCNYSAVTLPQRFAWLHLRSRTMALSERLTKVQTRRIARQTTDVAVDTRYIARAVSEMQDRMDEMESRMRGSNRRQDEDYR